MPAWPHLDTLLVVLVALVSAIGALDMSSSLQRNHTAVEGDDALLTCVVHELTEQTVVWKLLDGGRQPESGEGEFSHILTAGGYRITPDPRIMSLHDEGGDVFVLAIRNVTLDDSGVYICEVNSEPVARTFHTLRVVNESSTESSALTPTSHDFTSCCQRKNVSSGCLGYCSLNGLSQGATVEDGKRCEDDFPTIVSCMADGRNHAVCCHDQGVPQMCSHICRGEYYKQKDEVKDYFSCTAFTDVMINCIALGIETLPANVNNLQVTVISINEIKVDWELKKRNAALPDFLIVNVTRISTFDNDKLKLDVNITQEDASVEQREPRVLIMHPFTQLQNVSYGQNTLTISNLEPLTIYEISVTAHNKQGSSVTSEQLRVVTWLPETKNYVVNPPPGLPDVKKCCEDAGVTEPRCLRKLCDPQLASDTAVADVIICAPWAEKTFSCMADKMDHSSCCRAKGLPPICVDLCAGNVTKVDYRHFRCLGFMGSYTSCLMQGYGVVPSEPLDPRTALVDSTFAVLRWNPPAQLSETVSSYNLHFKQLEDSSFDGFQLREDIHSPFLLDSLLPGSVYEFYVEAINLRGAGAQSSRVVFKTEDQQYIIDQSSDNRYDMSNCCIMAEMSPECMPLCHYNVRMSTFTQLSNTCSGEYHKLVRCAAGGRDHEPCCQRRGVPEECLNGCRGHSAVSDQCNAYIGNLFQCFEEGTGVLPPPVTGLHVSGITNGSITLAWELPFLNTSDFQVRYGLVNSRFRSNINVATLDKTLNVSTTYALVEGLAAGSIYSFRVVSINEYGSSLPVSSVSVNVSASNNTLKAVSSHPHSLNLASLFPTSFTISWSSPVIMHPEDRIRYNLYSRGKNATSRLNVTTSSLSHTFTGLASNSVYNIYITAVTDAGESAPSETMQIWTLPADPAQVLTPSIDPSDGITEGGVMTVLCEAVGIPVPSIALYINGMHIHEDQTHKLSTTIRNITRDLSQITCSADNGYGIPSQSTHVITIRRKPYVTAAPDVKVVDGDLVSLKCHVDASPRPKMVFWSDVSSRTVVGDDDYYQTIEHELQLEGHYIMELRIKSIRKSDYRHYYCHSENELGSQTKAITLLPREVPRLYNLGVSECCRMRNVSAACISACAFDVDIDAVVQKPECISDLDKLMTCAADGSDHRLCCRQRNVGRLCLDWCRGLSVRHAPECSIKYARDVVSCFEQGKDILPSPPKNVQVESISEIAVRITWDPPVKNADAVESYRIYWRQRGGDQSARNDTASTWVVLDQLQAGMEYECAIKAGNHYGSSQLSETTVFVPSRIVVTSDTAGVYLSTGIFVVVILMILLVLVAFSFAAWMYRHKQKKENIDDRVCFTNPGHARDRNLQNLQMTTLEAPASPENNNSCREQAASSDAVGHTAINLQQGARSALTALRDGLRLKPKIDGFQQFDNE